jgi:hypothetical protein
MLRTKTGEQGHEEVVIRGKHAVATSPEGGRVSMPVEDLFRIIAGSYGQKRGPLRVLPDGVKLEATRDRVTIWVYERPPQVYSLKWIAGDSPAPFGKGARYTTYRIALPYLIVMAVYFCSPRAGIRLSDRNECFFRTAPLKTINDELCYPALLNCSRFEPPQGQPLSWICTAKIHPDASTRQLDDSSRMRVRLQTLLHCLLETGYNYSSEHHEASSWFTETVRAGVDPRITSDMRAWESASADDPLFVLDVPWLPTGMTVGTLIERIFRNAQASSPALRSAGDIQRLLFNHVGGVRSSAGFGEEI